MTTVTIQGEPERQMPGSMQGALNGFGLIIVALLAVWMVYALVRLDLITTVKIYGGMVAVEALWMVASLLLIRSDKSV